MPPNTLNAPEKGDLILIRRASSSANQSQASIVLIWDVPGGWEGVRATTSNMRVVDVSLFLPYQPTERFLNTTLGQRVTSATTAENATNNFRAGIDIEAYNLRSSFFESHAYPLAAFLGQDSSFFLRPSAEAVRKVLLGDRCPNEHCENGLVAATHRAAVYQRYSLGALILARDRNRLPMVCPACSPKDLVIESEHQFLAALRLDAGPRMGNAELDAMRANQIRLDDRRLESGYEKIKVCPDVVWRVVAHGQSG